jgi:hypothetical protein
VTAVFVDAAISDEERRAGLYSGAIYMYAPSPATLALAELARNMLEQAFAPHDPREIHHDPGHPASAAARLQELMPHAELALAATRTGLASWTGRISRFLAAVDRSR